MTESLVLSGKQIKGHDLKISVSLPLASEDVSGQSSKTAKIQKGDKAKTVSVGLQIKFLNAKDLTALVALAEAKDKAGARVIYQILERTANAMNIREVTFDNNFNVSEDATLELWTVSFDLAEHNSVAEKKEATRAAAAKKAVATKATVHKKVNSATSKQSPKPTAAPAQTTAPANPTPSAPVKAKPKTDAPWLGTVLDEAAKRAGF